MIITALLCDYLTGPRAWQGEAIELSGITSHVCRRSENGNSVWDSLRLSLRGKTNVDAFIVFAVVDFRLEGEQDAALLLRRDDRPDDLDRVFEIRLAHVARDGEFLGCTDDRERRLVFGIDQLEFKPHRLFQQWCLWLLCSAGAGSSDSSAPTAGAGLSSANSHQVGAVMPARITKAMAARQLDMGGSCKRTIGFAKRSGTRAPSGAPTIPLAASVGAIG